MLKIVKGLFDDNKTLGQCTESPTTINKQPPENLDKIMSRKLDLSSHSQVNNFT